MATRLVPKPRKTAAPKATKQTGKLSPAKAAFARGPGKAAAQKAPTKDSNARATAFGKKLAAGKIGPGSGTNSGTGGAG